MACAVYVDIATAIGVNNARTTHLKISIKDNNLLWMQYLFAEKVGYLLEIC